MKKEITKDEVILNIEKVTQKFGDFKAVNEVSFNIKKGELSSIIGPNGAGKTTLFNTISGKYKPANGKIIFDGVNITDLPIYEIVKLKLGRTFQITSIFPTLTVYENLQSALISKEDKGMNFLRSINSYKKIHNRIMEMVQIVGLTNKANIISANLTHSEQKILDISIALIQDPLLLLLDEPTSGMGLQEKERVIDLIEKLWKMFNVTIIFIEHDIDIVFGISQLIRVMHQGSLIAEGKPEEVRKNRAARMAYLGEE